MGIEGVRAPNAPLANTPCITDDCGCPPGPGVKFYTLPSWLAIVREMLFRWVPGKVGLIGVMLFPPMFSSPANLNSCRRGPVCKIMKASELLVSSSYLSVRTLFRSGL